MVLLSDTHTMHDKVTVPDGDVLIHELLRVIRAYPGLSDIFGQPGHVCQATELWRIRNDHRIL